MRTAAILSCLCVVASACAAAPPTSAESAARACIDRLIDASNRRDLEAAADSYCEDAVLHPPQGEAVRGRAAIRARYATMYSDWRPSLSVEHTATSVEGDRAIDRGFTRGELEPLTTGEARIVADAYEAVLRRDDGVWRVLELSWRPRASVRGP
jgi:uncharacterized protein (TIGR02246 family)